MTEVLELFGETTSRDRDWAAIVGYQVCPFLKGRAAAGVAACLGLKAEPTLELGQIVAQIERKLSDATLLEVR